MIFEEEEEKKKARGQAEIATYENLKVSNCVLQGTEKTTPTPLFVAEPLCVP